LKLGRQCAEQVRHPPQFFIGGLVKHIPRAGFEPVFADAEGEGNKMDNPVVDRFMAALQFGDIAVTDEVIYDGRRET
jgi:hypothetical protein